MLTLEEFEVILERFRTSNETEADFAALRRSLKLEGDVVQIRLLSEQVTINIGNVDGKEIQFGERHIITYVTVDAIKIRNLIKHSP